MKKHIKTIMKIALLPACIVIMAVSKSKLDKKKK